MDRDVGCPGCGFNLRGLVADRCPECNTRIQLILAQPEALWRMRRWIVAATLLTAISLAASVVTFATFYSTWGAAMVNVRVVFGQIVSIAVLLGLIVTLIRYAIGRNLPGAQARLLKSWIIAALISSGWSIIGNMLTAFF